MLDKDFCVQKIEAAINLIDRLIEADYPHTDSRAALKELRKVYEGDHARLQALTGAQPNTILEHCRRANINIVRLKKFLGMLIRSANIRNAFEIYFPIKILAQALVGTDTALVLSSEWEFSPFIYPVALRELPNFIFIGVPASECQNPLIVPLAAHELGHVVWNRKGVKASFDKKIRDITLDQYRRNWGQFCSIYNINAPVAKIESDLVLRSIWGTSYEIAQRQLEEVFCDFSGLYVFGPSYLHSFRYLLSPSLGHYRDPQYPRIRDRARYLRHAGVVWRMSPDPNYDDAFSEQDRNLSKENLFVLQMADATTESLHSAIPDLVEKHFHSVPKYVLGSQEETRAKSSMLSIVPAANVTSITPIINAAWSIRLAIDDWDILGDIDDSHERKSQKIRVLRDLALKGLEVYEYKKRIMKHAP